MTQGLYLEDLKVGDRFQSGHYEMKEDDMIAFAKEFDPQVFHVDPDKAKDTFFQGLAASGWHTASATMRLMVDSVPFAKGSIGAGVNLKWPSPTRSGDILQAESVITKISRPESKPNQGFVTIETTSKNQYGEVRVIITSTVVIFTRDHYQETE